MTTTFGALLRQLRRRAQMTQADLAAAVGYSVSFISSLEQNTRRPDVHSVLQHFVPALALQEEPHLATHLLELAAAAQGDLPPTGTLTLTHERRIVITETNPEPPTNLPTPPTPLIGRDETVKMLCDRLLGHQGRLLTLVGPPGVGKTRLALAVAANLQPFHADGVYFVSLASVSDPDWVASVLVNVLAIADSPDKPLEKRLIESLRRKELLLLLDNFEQVSAAAPLVATLLAECPRVRILVTSRERLHLRAEQRYPVQPLAIAAACQLFVQRAQAVDPAFILTSENQPVIVAICQHLDCLPLALELSAVQVDFFSPQALLANLQDHRLDMLANGLRDLPAHHRTLRHAIERSYDLLPDQEQTLLRALGVFVGGFDRQAVVALGFAEATLQALVHKSLVQVESCLAGEPRFLLLETVRAYAGEQLAAQGEVETMQRAHAAHFLRLAAVNDAALRGRGSREFLIGMDREATNLCAALDWAVANDPSVALPLLAYLLIYWSMGRYSQANEHWVKAAVSRIQREPTLPYADFLYGLAALHWHQADQAGAQSCLQESIACYRHFAQPAYLSWALNLLAHIYHQQGDHAAARRLAEESVAICRQLQQPALLANALDRLRWIVIDLDELTTAHTILQEMVALWRSCGNTYELALALRRLAHTAFRQGDLFTARGQYEEALQIFRNLQERWEISQALLWLGRIAWGQSDKSRATALLEEDVILARALAAKEHLSGALLLLGLAAQAQGDQQRAWALLNECLVILQEKDLLYTPETQDFAAYLLSGFAGLLTVATQGATLLGVASKLLTTDAGLPDFAAEHAHYKRILTAMRRQLDEADFAAAYAKGQTMSLQEAVTVVLTASSIANGQATVWT